MNKLSLNKNEEEFGDKMLGENDGKVSGHISVDAILALNLLMVSDYALHSTKIKPVYLKKI